MLSCSQCGTLNREGSKFCNNCGARLKPPEGAICPMCGTANQMESVFCSNCGARLVPLTAAPNPEKPTNATPIKGLSLPAKMPPAPIPAAPAAPSAPPPSATPPPFSEPAAPADEANPPMPEPTAKAADAAPVEEREGEIPDWLKSLRSSVPDEEPPRSEDNEPGPGEEPAEDSEVPDWLARLRAEPPLEEEKPTAPPPVSGDVPDWIKQLQSQEPDAPSSGKGGAPSKETTEPSSEPADVPDWLKQLRAETPAGVTSTAEDKEKEEKTFPAEAKGSLETFEESPFREQTAREIKSDSEMTIPGWIQHDAGAETEGPSTAQEPSAAQDTELPGWLGQLTTQAPVQPTSTEQETEAPFKERAGKQEPIKPEQAAEIPAWLMSSEEEEKPSETPTWIEQLPTSIEETAPTAGEEEIPDWIKQLRAQEPSEEAAQVPAEAQEVQETEAESLIQALEEEVGTEAAAAPVHAELGKPEEEIPDWLKFAMPAEQAAEPAAEAKIPEAEPIEPALPEQVPAWVAELKPKQVRPVPAEMAGELGSKAEPGEVAGPLAGLRGVLPLALAVTEPHVSSKGAAQPEAGRGAHLFDSILAAPAIETEAPIAGKAKRKLTLRPFIYALLALAVIVPFMVPFGLAESVLPIRHTNAEVFFDAVQRLPANSTVLVAFDYDASMAGEMDLQANAIVRDLARRHIKLIALSTLETGPQIAQRVLDSATAGVSNYQYGSEFLNLGYLPGHEAGLADLAANGLPRNTVDFVQKRGIGAAPVTANIRNLKDVALVIELAGSEDTLKMWMEQVQPRAGVNIAAGVSAGVEPKAQTYYDAKQLAAVLSGLVGAAQYEILSNQLGLAVTSVDAQSAAQVLLILIIVLGNIAYWISRARGHETARAVQAR